MGYAFLVISVSVCTLFACVVLALLLFGTAKRLAGKNVSEMTHSMAYGCARCDAVLSLNYFEQSCIAVI